MSNEDFDKRIKTINDNLELAAKCSESEKKLFTAYKLLLEMEDIANGWSDW